MFWNSHMSKCFICLGLTGTLLMGGVSGTVQTTAFAASETVNIAVTDEALANAVTLTSPYNVGVNMEMSMISDEMWLDNGHWMEESFFNSGIKIVRWGYDAWVFDWEKEEPLLNNYQGGNNTKDDEGSYGLREFLQFCKRNDVIPLVDIPIETYDHRASSAATTGPESLALVKRLAKNMATYLNESGFNEVYFDMGNEPWSYVSCQYGGIPAATYGALFEDFYNIIKAVNPNYKLLLVHQGGAAAWNNGAEAAANGFYDGVDDHQYPRPNGWANYYARNDDKIFSNGVGGTTPADKIKILGECNLPWPNFPAYGTNLGSSIALLNGFLGLANDDYYHSLISWPSHWPTGATTANVGAASKPVGWFDTDAWYYNKETVRFNGPAYAQMIAQAAVLDQKVATTSSNAKIRTFAYANESKDTLKLVVLNKESLDEVAINLSIPSGYNTVNAMVMYGERNPNTGSASESEEIRYENHFDGDISLAGTTLNDTIPYGECALIYTFSKDGSTQSPSSFEVISPEANEEIGTAHTFKWESSANTGNYRLIISQNSDLSNPVLDVYTGGKCHYQAPSNLENDTTYYYKVLAVNKQGETENQSGVRQCRTVPSRVFVNDSVTQSSEAHYWTYDSGWRSQSYLGALQGDDHVSSTAGATASVTFNGTQARLYGVRGNWCGMVEISVDGGTAQTLDFYRPAPLAQSASQPTQDMLFDTGVLNAGSHTISIRVLSDKNPQVSGKAYIELDYAEVFNGKSAPEYHAKAPQVTADLPESAEKQAGDTLELTVQCNSQDGGVLNYEWYKNDILLKVTEEGTYSKTGLTAADAGEYYVRVTNFVNGLSKTIKSGVCVVTVASDLPELQEVLTDAENSGFCYIFNEDNMNFDGNRIVEGSAQDIARLKASTGGTLLVRYFTDAAENQVVFASGKDYAADHYGAIFANNSNGTNLQRIDFPDGMVANLAGMNSKGGWHTFIFSVDAADPASKQEKSVTSFDGGAVTQFPNYASWFNQNDNINDIQYLHIGGSKGSFEKSGNNTNFVGQIAFVAYIPRVFTQQEAAYLSGSEWVIPEFSNVAEAQNFIEKAPNGETDKSAQASSETSEREPEDVVKTVPANDLDSETNSMIPGAFDEQTVPPAENILDEITVDNSNSAVDGGTEGVEEPKASTENSRIN